MMGGSMMEIKRYAWRIRHSLEFLSIPLRVSGNSLPAWIDTDVFGIFTILGRNSVDYSSGPSYTTPYKPAEVDDSQSSHGSSATTSNPQVNFFSIEVVEERLSSHQFKGIFQGTGPHS
jgi:hypothetical protein